MELTNAQLGLLGGGVPAGILFFLVIILKCCGLPGWGDTLLRGNCLARYLRPSSHVLDTPSVTPHKLRKGRITAATLSRKASVVPGLSVPTELEHV